MIGAVRRLMMKLRAALSSTQQDDDFDAELENHLDLAAADAMRRGVPPERAIREAKLRLGSLQLTRELHREERGLPLLRDLGQDVRYALRSMRRAPGFTAVVTLTLALGIGANTAVFSLLNAALLRQLAVPAAHELVHVTAAPVLSLPMHEDIRSRQQVFVDLAASTPEWPVRLTIPPSPSGLPRTSPAAGGERRVDNFPTHYVSANYFAVMGLRPQLGRFFSDAEDRTPQSAETEGSVAVIGDRFWEREFGRDPAVLGRVVYVNRSACRIVGIAPRGFTGDRVGTTVELWVPLRPFSPVQYVNARGGQFTQSIGRLKPGVTITQAQVAMSLLFRDLRKAEWDAFPETRRHTTIDASAIAVRAAATGLDTGLRARFTTPLSIVMAMVVAVLLIACANVANLLLARSASRGAEFRLRVALGCSRQRMIRQLLTESLLLAGLGAAVGVAFASAGVQTMVGLADADSLEVRPDRNVLVFVTAVTMLAALAFGLAPALGGSRIDARRPDLAQSGSGRVTRRRLSPLLVFTQVGQSLAILIGAGLLVRSLQNLARVDLGFKPDQVTIFSLYHDSREQTPPSIAALVSNVLERVRAVPGVEAASLSTIPLFSDTDLYAPLRIHGSPGNESIFARFLAVSIGYPETVGMTLIEGRTLHDRDERGAPVALINEAFAAKYFAGRSAIGQVIELTTRAGAGRPMQIVGVLRDAKYNDVRAKTVPMAFWPIQQFPGRIRAIEVRGAIADRSMIEGIRQAIQASGPDLMIRRVTPLRMQLAQRLAAEHLIERLGVAFGTVALLLAAVGLYGVLAHEVTQRTAEIGVRIALGATIGDVLWLVLRRALPIVCAGIGAGIASAVLTSRFLAPFLFGLTPTDASTIAGATAILIAVAIVAAGLPAARAARLDPTVALRHQ
jgi:predicted permease